MYSKANKKYYEPDIDYPSESAITVYTLCSFLQREDEKVCLSCTCALMKHGYSRLLKVMYLIVFYQIHTTFAIVPSLCPQNKTQKSNQLIVEKAYRQKSLHFPLAESGETAYHRADSIVITGLSFAHRYGKSFVISFPGILMSPYQPNT